jgi:tRNA-Thr(GGU) m(6)t(6)A37 methyltransferase TsaA
MQEMRITAIGTVESQGDKTFVIVDKSFVPGLKGLDGFSHVNILWWCDGCDAKSFRNTLVAPVPYRKAAGNMGVFATRSPQRPNPVALTAARILHIDHGAGRILVSWIDAENGSPVIDLKPYTPSLDRVEAPSTPEWCSHWPKSLEESAEFDWGNEFR